MRTSLKRKKPAKLAARVNYDNENQLSAQLITITIAFIALLATAISTSNVLYVIADFQKITILGAMVIFCLSFLVGLINYFKNIRAQHRRGFMIAQIVLVFLGLLLTIGFVASLLFYTTHQEDYTDELPIYDEIMDDQAAAQK